MHGTLSRDRRDLGRSQDARLHRNPPACGRLRAQRNAMLACPAWRHCELERGPDALAGRERSIFVQHSRSARARIAGLGLRAVPGAGISAWLLERRL